MSDQDDIKAIMRQLPHRFPFLLVDRVLSCEPGKSITAIKNVTINEPFFPGHFPSEPVMPGVLILEALAQAGLILGMRTVESEEGTIVYFAGIDKARFKRRVVPGDQLLLKLVVGSAKKRIWRFDAEAWVGDELACRAQMMAVPGKPDAN
ncbi:(3R)-hydroxymyristoyl-ACP dehydratase [Salinisphaera shabanensis T35B1]|jgi:3-hydroxyacyl-[acyl-carrier-protein] dehydratase|uniref:3-hydroxyacyl-[acyl-carrier-protein] dehydratase FabZ n=1 Tax=Salinisphaera shabanensis E1L3A TaxID=1033802 RepID=U2FVJ2_9GAMM|nr:MULTISPECIES: 3-hydroxyacyl-ACP dehydratase FabZ [Salinisphaera]ERJ19929.1 3-hydroxyacyl-acyl-carrier-protein dehydratase FabZ [Salinisphaera shabanensis E1L3A]MBS63044.1 3-hydroxyacyl-[acyl-carrier-protein] dehydratase FabZ [Salinisphaera sp.]